MARPVAAIGVTLLPLMLAGQVLAGTVVVDEVWTHPQFSSLRPQRVAVLPAITFDENETARWLVPQRWRASICTAGYVWIPASLAYEHLGSTPKDRVAAFRALSEQVRSGREPKPSKARELARLLNADALLVLRVDRWEHQIGARKMFYVGISASLVDSAGTCLWRSTSRSRVQGEEPHAMAALPAPDQGVGEQAPKARPSGGSTSGPSSGSSGSGSVGPSPNASTSYTNPRPAAEDGATKFGVPVEQNGDTLPMFQAAVDSMFAVWAPKFPGAPRPTEGP